MPHIFRTKDQTEWKPGKTLRLELADGTPVEAIWGGSAQYEKLRWWVGKAGHDLAQTCDEVTEVAVRDEDTGEVRWGTAPEGARLFFVREPSPAGKDYRIGKMVTTAATKEQAAYFNEERFSLYGVFRADGGIEKMDPPPPPNPDPRRQPDLFDM